MHKEIIKNAVLLRKHITVIKSLKTFKKTGRQPKQLLH